MTLILNLETATTVCSVSLAKDGELLAVKEINGDYSHAENLTVFIEDVMKEAGKKLSDMDAVAVSKGPGSYTGLRIGVSTAKGLCYSLNKPLIAINTLQYMALAMAENLTSHTPHLISPISHLTSEVSDLTSLYCPMIDARRMEVYCAVYDACNKEIKSISADIIDENSFADLLEKHPVIFFGDGSAKCKAVLSHHKNAFFLDDVVPSAKNMISLSEQAYINNQFEDIAYFEPFYLKDFIAGKKKGE